MTRTHILIGAAAAALISGAAFAQDAAAPAPADPAPSAMPEQKADGNVVNPPAASAMPMAPDSSADAAAANSASAMGADASVTASSAAGPAPAGSVTVTTLTNGPVPDTKANRVKYGQPQSHAGKMSRAAGN